MCYCCPTSEFSVMDSRYQRMVLRSSCGTAQSLLQRFVVILNAIILIQNVNIR